MTTIMQKFVILLAFSPTFIAKKAEVNVNVHIGANRRGGDEKTLEGLSVGNEPVANNQRCSSNNDCKDGEKCKHLHYTDHGECIPEGEGADCCQLDCKSDADCCDRAPNCITQNGQKYCNHDCERMPCETYADCCPDAPTCMDGKCHVALGVTTIKSCFKNKNEIEYLLQEKSTLQ